MSGGIPMSLTPAKAHRSQFIRRAPDPAYGEAGPDGTSIALNDSIRVSPDSRFETQDDKNIHRYSIVLTCLS